MHQPVMLRETLASLAVRSGGRYIDATLGGGGHAEAILIQSGPDGRLLGLDRDPAAIRRCRERLASFGERFEAAQTPFSALEAVAAARGFRGVDGVLLDFGVSSFQLDEPERGFSFRADGPLDMRMDPAQPRTAADWVNGLDEAELAELLRTLGEEPAARRIARAIAVRRRIRPFRTTLDLAAVVAAAAGGRTGRVHPATRTFQALRMAVNAELDEARAGLDGALAALRPGGRLVALTFHSLEDRVVKQFLRSHEPREEALPGGGARRVGETPPVRRISRRRTRPTETEVRANPRARSAGLRAAERMDDESAV